MEVSAARIPGLSSCSGTRSVASTSSRRRAIAPGNGHVPLSGGVVSRSGAGRSLVATAASNGNAGNDGRLGGLDDELRALAEAEAAADAALRQLEDDRQAAFTRALKAGEKALEEGLVVPDLPDDVAERFASARSAEELLALMDSRDWDVLQNTAAQAASDSKLRSLEFSLEEIEEELLQKVRLSSRRGTCFTPVPRFTRDVGFSRSAGEGPATDARSARDGGHREGVSALPWAKCVCTFSGSHACCHSKPRHAI